MENKRGMRRPRILEVELGGAQGGRRRAWRAEEPRLDRLGRGSGAALGVALWLEHAPSYERRAGSFETSPTQVFPFVIAVGDCVRRGLPTAARASLIARAPLTGRLAQGQVGGDLGRRLASLTDALVLRGRAPGERSLLVLEADGGVRVERSPLPAEASPVDVGRLLIERFGPCASLRVGPAARRGLPFANLASGREHQSFVGRGGLGAAFAAHGLDALVVLAEPVADAPPTSTSLLRALASSPRLVARGAGGTLELFDAFAARGATLTRASAESRRRSCAIPLPASLESDPAWVSPR
jgi:hypothetical protein